MFRVIFKFTTVVACRTETRSVRLNRSSKELLKLDTKTKQNTIKKVTALNSVALIPKKKSL